MVIQYKTLYDKLSGMNMRILPPGHRYHRMLQRLAGWYLNSDEYRELERMCMDGEI